MPTRSRSRRASLASATAIALELVHADYRSLGAVLDATGHRSHRRRARRSRRVVAAVRARGTRLQFRRDEPLDMRMDRSGRADGGRSREPRRRATTWPTRSSASARSAIRGGSRARSSRRARRAGHDDRAAGLDRAAGGADARLAAHRSGDAHVPGAADLGERRAGRSRPVRARRGVERLRDRRPARRDHVSLARGPHRQAHDARAWSKAATGCQRADEEAARGE